MDDDFRKDDKLNYDTNKPSFKTDDFSDMEEINKKVMRLMAQQKKGDKESELIHPSAEIMIKEEEDASISLERLLISRGLISQDQLQVALKHQRDALEKRDLGEVLVELGFVSDEALSELFSETSGIESFNLKSAALDVELIRKVPKQVAIKYKIIPISLHEDKLQVATSDVFNIVAFDQVKKYFDKQVKVVPQYANEIQITDVIDKYYEYEMHVEGILREMEADLGRGRKLIPEEQGYINPTVRLVDAILFDAIKREASDIHFEPENNFIRLRYRIDGKLMQILTFHKDYWSSICVRIKIISNMNIAETRNPQDGRISYSVMGRTVDFRVSTQPTVHGENIVARILDKAKSLVSLEDLGLSKNNLELMRKVLKRPEGVIIVTGPTGCGKSTTLYSVLSYINSITINIMTLEDPVEYQLPLIRQSGVKEGSGMNFAEGIRSMMRQDPDVIFVGEVRDKDTATMTIRAAMTGHRVFTTLHTNDSVGAISRLVDLGIKGSLLAGTMICIIAQRLARKLCVHCKEQYTPSNEEREILSIDKSQEITLYRHVGCEKCYNTGYKGRIAIFELLPIDREIDDMISRECSRKEILNYAREKGFVSMAVDGLSKVLEGVTDLEELINTVDMTERMK